MSEQRKWPNINDVKIGQSVYVYNTGGVKLSEDFEDRDQWVKHKGKVFIHNQSINFPDVIEMKVVDILFFDKPVTGFNDMEIGILHLEFVNDQQRFFYTGVSEDTYTETYITPNTHKVVELKDINKRFTILEQTLHLPIFAVAHNWLYRNSYTKLEQWVYLSKDDLKFSLQTKIDIQKNKAKKAEHDADRNIKFLEQQITNL